MVLDKFDRFILSKLSEDFKTRDLGDSRSLNQQIFKMLDS